MTTRQGIPRIDTQRIHGHEWMRRLHAPLYWLAALRAMRVGEEFVLGSFTGPGLSEDDRGQCSAVITREYGKYSYSAVWTITLRRRSRPHIFTSGDFRIEKGGWVWFLNDGAVDAESAFARVCRYIDWVERHTRSAKKRDAYWKAGIHPFRRGETLDVDGFNKRGVHGELDWPAEILFSVASAGQERAAPAPA